MTKTRKTLKKELKKNEFRVTIYGSARLNPNTKEYKQVFDLAKKIGSHGIDLVTGGGPGAMEAANAGHGIGDKNDKADSIGLIIKLPWEPKKNKHLEMRKHFSRFSKRLDNFMALSNAIVVTPGGIGTCLEFFYAWQLMQVKYIHPLPIILVGTMWEKLIDWVKKYQLKPRLISPENMQHIYICKNNRGAMRIILNAYKIFKKEGKDYYKTIKKYRVD